MRSRMRKDANERESTSSGVTPYENWYFAEIALQKPDLPDSGKKKNIYIYN